MGQRGPAPTSQAELEARGSWRAKARMKADKESGVGELVIEPGTPKRPRMSRDVGKVWDEYVALLGAKKVLTPADGVALLTLCTMVVEMRAMERHLEGAIKKKMMVMGGMDWRRLRSSIETTRGQILQYSTRFGLTPADRPRVKAEGGGKSGGGDDLSKFFAKPGAPGPLARIGGAGA